MIGRIRERFFTLRRRSGPEKQSHFVLHGNVHNIIAVKAPNDIFTEAIFILRDDYYLNSSAPDELLRQARDAAHEYAASVSVRDRWKNVLIDVLAVLLMLESAGLVMLIS